MKTQTGLRHSIQARDAEGNTLMIEIRLDDECKNGHQDFAITASGWEKGKPKTDKYLIYGGCCHETILEVRPDLKIFVDLHLADFQGIPMHSAANGFYHLRTGFNDIGVEDPFFPAKFCEYYRIDPALFPKLKTARNQTHFGMMLHSLGIADKWKEQADQAIKILEEMTGEKFEINSPEPRIVVKPEEAKEEREREKAGYYTEEATKARQDAKTAEYLAEINAEEANEIKTIKARYEAHRIILSIIGPDLMQQVIFYTHCHVGLNWRGYGEKIPENLCQKIAENLPQGITAKVK